MDNKDKYIGKIFDERYLIQGLIGEGGMSVVYKAQDQRLNRSVAVKIMRDEMASDEEFRRSFCAARTGARRRSCSAGCSCPADSRQHHSRGKRRRQQSFPYFHNVSLL